MLITLDVPNELGSRLSPFKQQLPQLLELGLREFNTLNHSGFHGVNEVLELLANLPSAEEIMALHPAKALQQRVNQLLEKQGEVGLTAEEEREWQQYEYLEHLVRIAKANALLKLNSQKRGLYRYAATPQNVYLAVNTKNICLYEIVTFK